MSKSVRVSAVAVMGAAAVIGGAPAWGQAGQPTSSSGAGEVIPVEGRYLSLDQLNAVKTPTPLIDIPQSLSIIDTAQIERQAFGGIGDVLRYTPGLSVSQGEGHRDAVIIRGNQTTADFFIDGLRDDVQYYRPLYNIEQIEILRGANALLFGRGGGGGVINRVTKRPVTDGPFSTLTASVDTFGAYAFAGDVNAPLSAESAFRLNAFFEQLENHRDAFDGQRFGLNPTLAFEPTRDTELLFSYEYLNDDRVVDRGVPSQNVDGGPDVPLLGFDDTFFGSPDENLTTLEAHILRGRVNHTFSDQLRGNLTLQYADYDKLYQNLYPSEEVVVTNGVFPEVELDGYQDETDRRNLIIQGNLVGEFDTGPLAHTLLVGFEYGDQETANSRNDIVFAANNDDQIVIPFTDPLSIPSFAFSNRVRDRQSTVRFTSLYLQDQVDVFDWLTLVAGLRYDRFDIDVLDLVERDDGDAVDGEFSRVDEEITPRYGLILRPVENVSAYASYSETFLPRSGDQFLTLTLDTESTRPQFVTNREIGVKWDVTPSLSLTAALFDLERESFTSVDPDDPSQVIVIEGAQTQGVEFEITGAVTDWWEVTAGYAFLDGEVQRADGGGFDGNRTRQTPEHMASIWNQFLINDRLEAGLGLTFQDSFFVREDNSVEAPSFTRVDAAVSYALSDRLSLQLNVENLLNEDYFPDAHSNDNITTGEPLNARLTVRSRF